VFSDTQCLRLAALIQLYGVECCVRLDRWANTHAEYPQYIFASFGRAKPGAGIIQKLRFYGVHALYILSWSFCRRNPTVHNKSHDAAKQFNSVANAIHCVFGETITNGEGQRE
jgi:hypothetical protein